eukprot:2693489-Rhodomonas_salina.3
MSAGDATSSHLTPPALPIRSESAAHAEGGREEWMDGWMVGGREGGRKEGVRGRGDVREGCT